MTISKQQKNVTALSSLKLLDVTLKTVNTCKIPGFVKTDDLKSVDHFNYVYKKCCQGMAMVSRLSKVGAPKEAVWNAFHVFFFSHMSYAWSAYHLHFQEISNRFTNECIILHQ